MTRRLTLSVRTRTLPFVLAVVWIFAGCKGDAKGWQKPSGGFNQFKDEVFPVLLRDCAFSTCHGSNERFFRIWGPGRVRLNPMTRALDPSQGPEVSDSYQLALSMVDLKTPSHSLILRKPLAVEVGGSGHRGADKFGRNIYRTVNDQGYVTIARWVFSLQPTPAAQ